VAANTLICLIHQANYLLDQLLRQLEKQFLQKGGFTERRNSSTRHPPKIKKVPGKKKTNG
jgi:four helix bundle suffix protein